MNKQLFQMFALSLCVILASCGGSGSDSSSEDVDVFINSGEQVTEENYAAIASGYYTQMRVQVAGMILFPSIGGVFYLQLPNQQSVIVDACDNAGSKTIRIMGSADNAIVDVGDSVEHEYAACEDDDSTKTGFDTASIESLSGVFDADGYSSSIRWQSEKTITGDSIAINNGVNEFDYLWFSALSADGELSYNTVNPAAFYSASDVPSDHPFRDLILSAINSDSGDGQIVRYTSGAYPTLGFEIIAEDDGDISSETYMWNISTDFQGSDYADYNSYTVSPFTLVHDDEELATGVWHIEMSTGELIRVESSLTDGVTVSLDFEMDGNFDHTREMTWESFTALFLEVTIDAFLL